MGGVLDSDLYKALRFRQKLNDFVNANEAYYFMFGYSTAQSKNGIPKELYEEWIFSFMKFIEKRLKDYFYPEKDGIRSVHFGEIINEHIYDSRKGVDLFYKILDEFVEELEKSIK